MTRPIALLALAGLALFALVALLGREVAASRADGARVAAVLERIEAAQSEQGDRLARLESRGTVPPPRGSAPLPPRPQAARAPVPTMSATDVRRSLEARFVAEPLSSAWAAKQEASVAAFLEPGQLATRQLVPPREHAVDCRSRTCRIEMVFDEAATAAPTQEDLVMAIGASLPAAQIFSQPRGDGRIEVVIFAGDRDALAR